ncbi:hypothetical protein FRC17_009399 [Serendipita sp. 399]|nr:hypothetical protein FRC17_009399 [Serendipita sp. 399]
MFMQSHTVVGSRVLPYLAKYQAQPIMVFGGIGDTCRRIAQDYGFRDVLIPADVFCWNRDIWPLHTPTEEEQEIARKDFDFSSRPISAAFVFHDPRNWAPDVQILLDLVRYGSKTRPAFADKGKRKGGDYRRHSATTNDDGDERVELIFCNPDLVWRGAYPEPRLGQGGFREAFQSLHTALKGKRYEDTRLGKPSTETFHHAENMLMILAGQTFDTVIPKKSIFMIGDNPESDIAGANKAGWNSVLVHTGVFNPGGGPPSHSPTFQARDVEEAVQMALEPPSSQASTLP